MAAKTYRTRALVLKKAKLGEKDLIVTLLSEDGSLIRAVAKGARKPGGSHAARAELFTPLAALLAEGRSLDVLCEARREQGVASVELSLEQSACCAAVAELITLVAQEGLAQRRLYELARASFDALGGSDGAAALLLCAAALWKVTAQAGFRPALDSCAVCGASLQGVGKQREVPFSALEGGALCDGCRNRPDAAPQDGTVLAWCSYVLGARYADIAAQPDPSAATALISLLQSWTSVHMGRRLKAIDFLFSPGLFQD